MAKKKNTQLSISEEENTQVQHVLEQYHQLANNLHVSEDQKQVETALAEINTLSESVQMALLKELSKEKQVDAADVLIAINELSPLKSIRKEARRSLIRLESAKIYPRWEPPIDRTPAISVSQLTTNTPRFWKGLVSDTRASGEVQLLLCWEQGEDYKEIRILGFLLEFMYDGVKDFFSSIDTKRGFDKFVAEIRASMPDVEVKDCSLARGRRLLLEALAVNKQHGTAPSKDYRFNLSLVKQLILEAPDFEEDVDLEDDADLEEESEESINLHGLHPHDVVVDFVESWVNEDYDIAYNLLSLDSPLREGLSRDEWIERRESWAAEVHPDSLKPDFMHEHELQKSQLWTPNPLPVSDPTTHKEIETGWSITLDKIPSDNTLPELPKATLIYEETGRHWFWPRYTLVQENDDWRIQNMTDEGMNAQNLSVEELQHKIEDLYGRAKEFADRYTPEEVEQLKDQDMRNYLAATSRRIIQAIYHTDILIKKFSLDFSLYEQAALRMAAANQYERSLAYLRPLTQRFPEQRGLWLRRMAAVQKLLSKELFDEGYDEQAERSLELAEEALQESLTVENNIEAHISIAELLIEDSERLDEAEGHLLQAKELITNPEEEAHIELHLGEIATEREQFEKALSHSQRIVELQPDSSEAWFDVGEAHEALEHFEEAETSYKRAIELEPDNEGYYYTLSKLYAQNDQPLKAMEVLEQGIIANPDSTILHLYIVAVVIESGDYHQAEMLLNKIERVDPKSELVHMYRQLLNLSKPKYTYDAKKLNKPLKQKKKRR
jgi:tetratricopeptide (TPR) repeat protein